MAHRTPSGIETTDCKKQQLTCRTADQQQHHTMVHGGRRLFLPVRMLSCRLPLRRIGAPASTLQHRRSSWPNAAIFV